jgi:hypothetical protein
MMTEFGAFGGGAVSAQFAEYQLGMCEQNGHKQTILVLLHNFNYFYCCYSQTIIFILKVSTVVIHKLLSSFSQTIYIHKLLLFKGQSWSYWQYKYFGDVTTSGNSDEGFFFANGTLQERKVRSLVRSYARRIQGKMTGSHFNTETGWMYCVCVICDLSFKLEVVLYDS